MAISPTDANCLNLKEMQEVSRWEISIDGLLQRGGRTIDVSRISHRVLDEVKRRYQAAGWLVRYVCDQRDGNYLEFSA